ncbi:type I 3-dehydroquinate dehydratase [Dehalogenimonas sp. THU2]|uniref:type I 3-dehydroquinate dehydratase n=1 Tax=Dehalogenimonas sp. THU2 TaxID=3151121 RepID=UPI003218B1E1
MNPAICAVITSSDEAAIAAAAPLADLYEVRIDLIGESWAGLARKLTKPWMACNRLATEGGAWRGTEAKRKQELLRALDMGASIIDLELATPNLEKMVELVKKRARCLVSHHDFTGTPASGMLIDIIKKELAAGADICKLVTTATIFDDNLRLLRLYGEFSDHNLICFGMGETGLLSRVMAPLAGAAFTYAALQTGRPSAPGQLTVAQMAELYRMIER